MEQMTYRGPATVVAPAGLRAAAESVLRSNDRGGYTVPSELVYPHQWNWDSALCALGWAELDGARAWRELESLAGAADGEGMLPHIAFRRRLVNRLGPAANGRVARVALARPTGYLPGPGWWGRRSGEDGRRISGITQPPLAATCMRLLFELHPDERRAAALLRSLHRWHGLLLSARDPDGLGEPVLVHPWESGRDNAVEWDAPLRRVRSSVSVLHRRDTDHVEAAERPSDEHYRRFLSLVREGTEAGWPQRRLAREGSFRVLDPGFSAILARACHDLAALAGRLGEPEIAEESRGHAERVAVALRRRAGADGLIRPVDLAAGTTLEATSAGSALTLLVPGLGERELRAACELVSRGPLASHVGARSLDRDHPQLSPRSYWRGPVWANLTWLCAHGLRLHDEGDHAALLRRRLLHAVERGGLREYFAPDSGEGLGAHDFSWTAALALRELAGRDGGAG